MFKKQEELKKARYKIFGHSAVKLCLWTRKSIKSGEKQYCYKQKFYGIKSHRCLQMTPSLPFCNLSCVFCWRNVNIRKAKWENGYDIPKEIIENSIKAQRSLLSGLGGVEHSKKHLREAQNPNQAAISLDGEPTLYPKISELIEEYHKRNFTTFLVTNGTFPEVLEKMTLPYQLYVSVSSNSKDTFKNVNRPITKNAWEKLNKTLELLPSLDTRKVIRLTLAKNLNFKNPEKYAELIKKAEPDFVEVKSAMAVGFARIQNRLKYSDMPYHNEIKNFAEKLANYLGYNVADEQKESRVVLLRK